MTHHHRPPFRRSELAELLDDHAAELDAGVAPAWTAARLRNLAAEVLARGSRGD